MSKFKTQNPSYTGSKVLNNNTLPLNMHSFSITQSENFENIDEMLQKNLTLEEKNSLAFKFVKTCKFNADAYPIERLMNNGVSPNCQDHEGKSLLMVASERGLLELVQALMDLNVDVKLKDKYGKTALFSAIEANNENTDVVSLLLEYGSDPNHEAQDRVTPLLRAVEKGYCEITKILLEKGGNIHSTYESTGDTALHVAVRNGDEKMIELLFDYGCDSNKKNKKKLTARDLCQSINPELLEYLTSLFSRQKVNQSNIIKTAIETPMAQEQTKTMNDEGKSSPVFNFINQFDQESNNRGQNQLRGNTQMNKDGNNQDITDQKKQKYQPNDQPKNNEKDTSKKNKGRNESPNGIRRSNYFPNSTQKQPSNEFPINFENSDLRPNTNQRNDMSHNTFLSESELQQDQSKFESAQNEGYSQNPNGANANKPQGNEIEEYARPSEGNPYHNQYQQVYGKRKNQPQMTPNSEKQSGRDPALNIQHNNPEYINSQGQGNMRGNVHPSQMKGNIPLNYYGQNQNPQFFNNPNNPNVPFQKRKSNKGQGNFKGFPNNTFNPNMPSNPNQYNRKGSGNFGDPMNPLGQQNPQMSPTSHPNTKFNKNQNKPYVDKNTSRGYMNPNMVQNTHANIPPNLQSMQGISHSIPQLNNEILSNLQQSHGMESFPLQDNSKNTKDVKMPQSPIVFHNNANVHQFHSPTHGFQDTRGINNLLPQNTFALQNQQTGNEGMGQLFKDPQANFNMINPQNNYNIPQNQFQMNQMANKHQFIQSFPYPNAPLLDSSNIQNTNIQTYHYDLNNNFLRTNLKLKADCLSVSKANKDTTKELEKTKQENNNLKTSLDILKQNEQKLKKVIVDKDVMIEELTKKAEDLENSIKNATLKSAGATYSEFSMMTEPYNFQIDAMSEFLKDPRPNIEFLKPEFVSKILHEEILSFEKAVNNFNMEKKNTFDTLLDSLKSAVVEAVPGADWDIYGSFATGLCLPWSDIDIVIRPPQVSFGTSVLDSIEQILKKNKFGDEVKIIRNTSVPVLKITCSKAYLNKKVDISMYDPRHNGLLCVELVKEYLVFYPALRSMVLILKQFLYKLNLNDTYLGGLSSYGLILMIVYLFQTREMQRSTDPMENQNLGSLLLSFLQFYGFEYDYYNQFLVNPRKIPKAKDKTNEILDNFNLMNILNQNPVSFLIDLSKITKPTFMEPKIIIQDPLSTNNNVGRSTFNIKEIKNAFMAAYFEAFKPCVCEIHKSIADVESINGKPQHKCTNIFKRMMFAYHPQKS